MEKNYKLYVHICPNGKRYYGITKQRPERRWANGYGYKGNRYFARAIEKYGWDNITHEILFDDLTESEAKELEQHMIQWYNTANRDYGYNISTGGESGNGCKHSEESKQKMSEAKKGRQFSEETKQKLSKNHADIGGKNNPRARSIICITTKKIFYTAKEAGDYYDTCRPDITNCCKGKYKSAGKLPDGTKLVWRYLNHKHNKTYRLMDAVLIRKR